jgi:transcriptional regulator with XRE-family HTH domain
MLEVVTGARLKTWRITNGLSQSACCRLFGWSRSTLIRAEIDGPRYPLIMMAVLAYYDKFGFPEDFAT